MFLPSVREACGSAIVIVLLISVFVPAQHGIQGVAYPYDADQFRDISLAQGIVDGKRLADPIYAGESIWYNPLQSWVLAGLSHLRGTSVPSTFVSVGPALNLLTPLAFFVMARRLVGIDAAVLATTFLLFTPTFDSSWATPSYSPWMFPAGFGFSVFCASLVFLTRAVRSPLRGAWLIAGISLGCTFLAHTAPAVILGTTAVVLGLASRSPDRPLKYRLSLIASMVTTALAVASPFIWSILIRYHLWIENPHPVEYTWSEIDVEHAGEVLARLMSPWTVAASAGLVTVVRRAARDAGSQVVLCWLGVSVLLFVSGWIRQAFPESPLPAFVPQYHFFYYVSAAGFLLVGAGASLLVEACNRITGRFVRNAHIGGAISFAALALAVGWFAASHYEAFKSRRDFQVFRDEALDNTAELARSDILNRLRNQTPPDAVILASAADSLKLVGPAGRYAVVLPPEFSNPYVSFQRRQDAQEKMLSSLAQLDMAAFRAMARRFGVTHVLLGPDQSNEATAIQRAPDPLRAVSEKGGYVLFSVGEWRAR